MRATGIAFGCKYSVLILYVFCPQTFPLYLRDIIYPASFCNSPVDTLFRQLLLAFQDRLPGPPTRMTKRSPPQFSTRLTREAARINLSHGGQAFTPCLCGNKKRRPEKVGVLTRQTDSFPYRTTILVDEKIVSLLKDKMLN